MGFVLLTLVLTVPISTAAALPFESSLHAFRLDAGLSMPESDPALAATCQQRADDLAGAGELAHIDADGRTPGIQAMAAGLPPGEYGEVLGTGPSEAEVWKAWLASPPHRSVLLEAGWASWAVGTSVRGNVSVFVVRFWKP